jgi:S1-C subfamily serine protease
VGQVVEGDDDPNGRTGSASSGARPGGDEEPVSQVAKALSPSVVQIETDNGLGSGVVYDDDGLILTAAHVVEGSEDVTVRLADGRRVAGRVVGSDEDTDVAVVRVSDKNLPTAPLGVGEAVKVGQLAVAIGSPFGLEGSVTSGVVSAIDRSVPINDGTATASMIQTDASINPGNSGGALADRHGTVIGINDLIRTESGFNSGVGFAIPIDIAASVADSLVKGAKPRLGFLGVSGTEPASGPAGALITDVLAGTPADSAGLQRGDLIVAFDRDPIEDMAALAARIRLTRPGTIVTLQVVRNGSKLEIDVRVAGR